MNGPFNSSNDTECKLARYASVEFIRQLVLLSGGTPIAGWNDVAAGIALILLSLPRGPIKENYGSWDRYARWDVFDWLDRRWRFSIFGLTLRASVVK